MTDPVPTAFRHLAPGTPLADWAALRAALPPGAAVGAHDHLVVLGAHPDDETLGAGGLLAAAARAGAQLTVVVATDGEASHPESPTHTPQQLAGIRRAEVAAAVAALAPDADVVLLQLPDGGLPGAADQLAAALRAAADGATVLAAPWRHDGHPDHEVCGTAAAALADELGARLLEYPIWGWHWGTPGPTGPLTGPGWVGRPLDDDDTRRKQAALAAYRSQHTALSPAAGDEPVLAPDLLAHFVAASEVFHESAPRDLPARYFERLYAGSGDPWRLTTGFYEPRKRQLLLAALPRPTFASAFEPGCARGLLTVELARRCARVLACDVAEAAVAATRSRVAGLDHVDVRRAAVPDEWPAGRFELVVISELGYYLADPGALAGRAHAALTDDGVLVACHWRHDAPGYPSTAQAVHGALGAGLHHAVEHVEADFLLDVWTVADRSVAQRDGVVA